jgi:predicted DNA binding protein
MWEVSYAITPTEGYFDRGEIALYRAGVSLESIRSMEFVSDGSVVIVYEVEGDIDAVHDVLDTDDEKVVEYSVTDESNPQVVQIWFHPDEPLATLLEVHQSFGISVEFPVKYVSHEPATIEVVETGPRDELRGRIEDTREVADVGINYIHRYDHDSEQAFRELTDRQQEVLQTAVELGYYQIPREATHEEIADELGCSKSVVGQHLRRVEASLVGSVVPDGSI